MNLRVPVLLLTFASSVLVSASPAFADGATFKKHLNFRNCHAQKMREFKHIQNRKERDKTAGDACRSETSEATQVTAKSSRITREVPKTTCVQIGVTSSGRKWRKSC